MICLSSTSSIKQSSIFILLMVSVAANASLLDCSQGVEASTDIECAPAEAMANIIPVSVLSEAIPAVVPVSNAAVNGFQINQPRSPGALTGSAPLIGLVCALLGVILLRAKRCNTK